jgi:hypothetical protein
MKKQLELVDMKIIIVLSLMMLAMSVQASTAWKLKNNFSVSKVWQHAVDSKFYVSIEKTKLDDVNEYKDILKDKARLAKFDENKKSTLALIGVSKWSGDSKEWTKINGKDVLKIQGTYEDNSEEKVYFREYHLIEGGNVLQVLFTSTNNDSYASQKDIEDFLKDVKMDEIRE